MADSGYGKGDAPLTPVERARLRESVRVDALDRWFAATGGEARRTVIAHFAREVTPEDIRALHTEIGSTGEELAEMERMLAEHLTPEPPPEPLVHSPAPGETEDSLEFITIPHSQLVIWMDPPDDPSLRALWNEIEPSQPPGATPQSPPRL